jgi:5-formyltetrahydrofolate cyclo-ligase
VTIQNKNYIRNEYINKRKTLSEGIYFELSQRLADQFFFYFHAKLLKINTLHIFLPIEKNKEPNTNFILKILFQRFKKLQIVVPKTDFDNKEMAHLIIDEETLFEENKYGIPEPIAHEHFPENDIDLVLVPLLAFDKNGHRIGYGGGFYDRFLAKLKPGCLKIGLSLFDPIESQIEVENTDIKLDFCITPHKIWEFSNIKG